jgi:hypothetical protein
LICTGKTLPHAGMRWGLSAYVRRTLLLSLSTVADAKISNPPWVNFQSAGSVFSQRQQRSQVAILVDGDELINSVNTDHIGGA